MRKFLLLFLAAVSIKTSLIAQQSYIKSPATTNTTTNIKAPNGTSVHATFRGVYLLSAAELSVIATNTAINSIGFYLNQGSNGPAVTGTVQVYLQNTSDVSYLKGISYSTAIAPMSSVYNSTMIVPAGGASTINLALPANFTYTGGGLYIAFDWVATGPFATNGAVYQANNSMGNGGASNNSTVAPAGDFMTATNTRPNFRIGYVNTYTNEAEAWGLLGNGRQPLINGSPYSFSVVVRNNAGVAMTNVVPTLSISGANAFVATQTIASIAAGATVMAVFPAYSPTAQGMNTVAVSFPPDDNNLNNLLSKTQSVTCNYINAAPPVPIVNFSQGVGFASSSGLLLSRMSVPNTSTLTSLRLGVANYNPNAGNSIYGVITNNFGTILATTNTVVITGSMFGTYHTFNFASPVSITGSTDYFIGMAQPASTVAPYFPLATMPSPSNNIVSNQYATSVIGGGFIGIQTPTLGWFAIEGVFDNGISLTVTPQTSTLCSGNSNTISASGAASYSWSNGPSTSSIVVTPNLYTVYTCTGSAIVGTVGACEDIKSSAVYVNITPTLTCPNGAICPVGGSFTLTPSGAATYTFSGGGAVVSPTTTTSYTINGTSGAGCPAANTVVATVSVSSSPSVSIAGPTLICNGTSASLTGQGAISYSWSNGSGFSAVLVNPSTTTTFSIVGTFGTCTNSAMHTLSVSPNPTLSIISSNTLLCIGLTTTLNAVGAQTYSWSTGGTGLTATISPTVSTTYTLTGSINGICTQTVTFTQIVDPCIGFAEHPGALSEIKIYPNPNNGMFTLFVSKLTDNSSVEIYNNLGQVLVGEKLKDVSTEMNLKNLPGGVYFIKLKENNKPVRSARIIIQ